MYILYCTYYNDSALIINFCINNNGVSVGFAMYTTPLVMGVVSKLLVDVVQ